MMEENDFEELGSYFIYEANIIENPKNAVDFNHNGMIKFFSNEKSTAIVDFNKSIELNPDSANSLIYFVRGLIKNDLNIKGQIKHFYFVFGFILTSNSFLFL